MLQICLCSSFIGMKTPLKHLYSNIAHKLSFFVAFDKKYCIIKIDKKRKSGQKT